MLHPGKDVNSTIYVMLHPGKDVNTSRASPELLEIYFAVLPCLTRDARDMFLLFNPRLQSVLMHTRQSTDKLGYESRFDDVIAV